MDLDLVKKYYTNLDYAKVKSNQHETSISAITRDIKLEGEHFLNRSTEATKTITTNLSLFKSVCNHSDVPIAIRTYLWTYPSYVNMSHDFSCEKGKREIWTVMLTLFNFCAKKEVQNFLETCLIENLSKVFLHVLEIVLQKKVNHQQFLSCFMFYSENLMNFLNKNTSADNYLYREYKNLLSHQTIEMILLEDSDLYAVINNLKISENCRYLDKIWVPQSIKHNFLLLRNKYFKNLNSVFHIYKSKQELLTPPKFYKINVTSIWSENIMSAKNLAASLDRNIVLINTLEFYESMVIMPYLEIFKVSLSRHLELNEDQHIINTIKPIMNQQLKDTPSVNLLYSLLFYDGTWQTPVKDNYWMNKTVVTANATSDDVSRCVVSARKGFKIWSTWTNKSRMQVLSKLASALKHAGKIKLSKIVCKWIKFPHWYESSSTPQYSDIPVMALRIRNPKGIITLMERDEMDLFRKLTQSLVIGNSVIVICTAQSCDLVQYCGMFSISGIPPGVINVLSCEDIKPLSENFNATELREMYYQFTVGKQILTFF